MKVFRIALMAGIFMSLASCSAEQEIIQSDTNLKAYKEMDFSKVWGGLEYRKTIKQKTESKK